MILVWDGEQWQVRRVLVTLVVEPTVVLPQRPVERGSTLSQTGRVVEARRPDLKARVSAPGCSRTPGWWPNGTNREIVGRQWTRVLCGFQGIRSPGTCVGAAMVRDRRLAVFGGRF